MIETPRKNEDTQSEALNVLVHSAEEALAALDAAQNTQEQLTYPIRVVGYVEGIGSTSVVYIVNTRAELTAAVAKLKAHTEDVAIRLREMVVDKLSAVDTTSRTIETEAAQPLKTVAHTLEEALEKVHTDSALAYPLLVIPWGENSGGLQYVVHSDEGLTSALEEIYETSGEERRVHLITKAGSVGDLWKEERVLDPVDGIIEEFEEFKKDVN